MNTVTVNLQNDGPRNVVAIVQVALDGSGDITDPYTIIDLAQLSSMGSGFPPHPTRVSVGSLSWSLPDGLSINLWWDGLGPANIFNMSGRGNMKGEFFAGLNVYGDNPNGNITLTTLSTVPGVPLNASFTITCVKQA